MGRKGSNNVVSVISTDTTNVAAVPSDSFKLLLVQRRSTGDLLGKPKFTIRLIITIAN